MSVKSFVIELNEKVNSLLSQFDVALTLDEVIIGGIDFFLGASLIECLILLKAVEEAKLLCYKIFIACT